jgi:cell division protein FtsI (penicillin-binding protein 3)
LIRGLKPAPRRAAQAAAGRTHIEFEGVRKAQGDQAKNRIIIAIACFGLIYSVIGGRLVYYGSQGAGNGVVDQPRRPVDGLAS